MFSIAWWNSIEITYTQRSHSLNKSNFFLVWNRFSTHLVSSLILIALIQDIILRLCSWQSALLICKFGISYYILSFIIIICTHMHNAHKSQNGIVVQRTTVADLSAICIRPWNCAQSIFSITIMDIKIHKHKYIWTIWKHDIFVVVNSQVACKQSDLLGRWCFSHSSWKSMNAANMEFPHVRCGEERKFRFDFLSSSI